MLSRFTIAIPLVLSLVAFVLSNLCLFAGRDKGFMEDYAIARLNTSMLGHSLLASESSSSSSDDDNDDDGLFEDLKDKWNEVKDDIIDEINNVTSQIVDEWAEALGIAEWYSLHVVNVCEGYYKGNATNKNAGLNITHCTKARVDFNVSEMLNKELSIGPVDLSLADLGWSDEINDALDNLNDALLGLFIVYLVAIIASGIAMIGCVAALVLFRPHLSPRDTLINSRWAKVNSFLASLAAMSVFTGSVIVTVTADKAIKKLNRYGDDVGVSATKGNKFRALSWTAVAFAVTASLYWMAHKYLIKRQQRREWTERKANNDSPARGNSHEMTNVRA
ncbi:actin cortical patch SUR7/pH-response regulator pali [Thelonectria olida]|uniref:Actin cortical patch SUR7/pH-response regulator pali n=1 Tax=Thelonectria olida TaxID=1576542 RepID=A0A9P8WAS5_9HYPO|nr:actin cortical patch SUR7/pH-response regulator pali [Thelonectria olida]